MTGQLHGQYVEPLLLKELRQVAHGIRSIRQSMHHQNSALCRAGGLQNKWTVTFDNPGVLLTIQIGTRTDYLLTGSCQIRLYGGGRIVIAGIVTRCLVSFSQIGLNRRPANKTPYLSKSSQTLPCLSSTRLTGA